MDKEIYTMTEIAEIIGIPPSTARYYRDKFSAYIPSEGEGKSKRYYPEALEIIKFIAESYKENRTTMEIERALASQFGAFIDSQQLATVKTQQPDEMQERFLSALERIADSQERISKLEQENKFLQQQLDELKEQLQPGACDAPPPSVWEKLIRFFRRT